MSAFLCSSRPFIFPSPSFLYILGYPSVDCVCELTSQKYLARIYGLLLCRLFFSIWIITAPLPISLLESV